MFFEKSFLDAGFWFQVGLISFLSLSFKDKIENRLNYIKIKDFF